MAEFWDVYSFDNQQLLLKTGEVVSRDAPFPSNGYHLVVQAWIRNSQGEYLISQRSKEKGHAFHWEMTGGGVQAGENSLQAACREVKEELGVLLPPEKGHFCFQGISQAKSRKDVVQVWLFDQIDIDVNSLTLQEEEVSSAMWASKNVIYAMRETNLWMPWKNFDYIDSFLGPREPTNDSVKKEIIDAANWLKEHRNENQGNILMAIVEKNNV